VFFYVFDAYSAGLVVCLIYTIAVGASNWGVGACATSMASCNSIGIVPGSVVLGANCIVWLVGLA
jgi:hypothetical protein